MTNVRISVETKTKKIECKMLLNEQEFIYATNEKPI